MEVSRLSLTFPIMFSLFVAFPVTEGRISTVPSSAGNVSSRTTASGTGVRLQDSVAVLVYYESLCPYCSNFIVNYLSKLFTDGLISTVDLRLVPSGNARILPNQTIQCQHGPYECFLNTVEACAIDAWPDVHTHFRIIHCLEGLALERRPTEWESCFTKNVTELRRIGDCYNSGRGKELELKYLQEFDQVKDRPRYVPWVVVNGHALHYDYANVEQYVCKTLPGVLPEACKGLPEFKSINNRNERYTNGVCRVDQYE